MKRHGWKDGLLNVIFPERCPWCGRVTGFAQRCTCANAVQKIRLPDEPLELMGREGCGKDVQKAWACFIYQSPVKEAYYRLKFEGEKVLSTVMGQEMAGKYSLCCQQEKFDCLIPVPISSGRLRERGYNQSEWMAEEMAARIGLVCEKTWLVKVRETERQMDLSREERLVNVKGAYELHGAEEAKGKRVLLVDDVLTTGSTLGECARVLGLGGVESCSAFTLLAAE